MSEAIFGLVGVIIGGLINGGVTFVGNRANRRHEARSAARLLHDEVLNNCAAVQVAIERQSWVPLRTCSAEVWELKREVFAGALSNGRWEALSDFYYWVGAVRAMPEGTERLETLVPIRGLGGKRAAAIRAVKEQSKLTGNLKDDLDGLIDLPPL